MTSDVLVSMRLTFAAHLLQNLIETDPNKAGGIPVLSGTRFKISQVLAEIADGKSLKGLARDFSLDREKLEITSSRVGNLFEQAVQVNCFQFDECSSSNALLQECKRDGLCLPRRYPKKHSKLKDPQMLGIYMAKDGTLVTFDLSLIDEHEAYIPPKNPGIILIGRSPRVMKTMTETAARKIMRKFKALFPDWCQLSWKNSIVKFTEATIFAGRIIEHGAIIDFLGEIDSDDWKSKLRDILTRNSGI